MTPFYFAPQRYTLMTAPAVFVAAGLLMLHPIHLNFGGTPTASAPAAYTSSASSTVYLSQQAATSAAQTATSAEVPMTEIHIANDGLTLLRGARVTSTSGGALQISLSWGGAQFAWNVHTAYGTEIMNSDGQKALITDIHVGDTVTVTGDIDQNSGGSNVVAQYIRDQSI